jgi:hypothetical protein
MVAMHMGLIVGLVLGGTVCIGGRMTRLRRKDGRVGRGARASN